MILMTFLLTLVQNQSSIPKLASKVNSTCKEYHEYLKDPIEKSVFLSPVIDEIIKIITKFDQTKSPGHDNIGNNIIKL